MSYLPSEPTTFINIKLTDAGRRLLSLGQLTFNKAVFSDREIDYGIDRTGAYHIDCCNKILSPKDDNPTYISPVNFDGSAAQNIIIGSSRKIITATSESIGFFTGSTNSWAYDSNEYIGYAKLSYSSSTIIGTNKINITGGTYFPTGGELVYIPWQPINNSGFTYSANDLVYSANSTVALWYRVLSSDTGTTAVYLDRPVPNFGITTASTQALNVYFYPFNGVEVYYGSAATVNTSVWNMNIVRTSSLIGTDSYTSGYTTYGSIEYNGTKQYLGFTGDTNKIGIVHYTNEFTGNTYAEQLIEKSVIVDIPNIMWHRNSASPGQGVGYGLRLTDAGGPTIFDSVSQTKYRPLRDGNSSLDFEVGRVYHKLKLIVITDPELLASLTYKSNRNYTLPELTIGTSPVPKPPLTTGTGLLETGYTYFITYKTNSNYQSSSGVSYGYPEVLPCDYVQKIDGALDGNGNPQFLKAYFSNSFFPYLRTSAGMVTYSGTGWNANSVQLLLNKVSLTAYPSPTLQNIPTDTWKLISGSGTTIPGNGIFTGTTGEISINPMDLASYQFIISQEDYDSGSTYTLSTAFTTNTNVSSSGLTFGSEAFFFGNIRADILATTFKTVMTALAPDQSYNASDNETFDSLLDSNTYITEIGILNNNNILVALGKPTYPIKKNAGRYLTFQLEIDF